MEGQIFNIAEAKMHLSRLIERVEHGERITIARNNKPVVVMSPARPPAEDVLANIDAIRNRIFKRHGGRTILKPGETWREFIDEGHLP